MNNDSVNLHDYYSNHVFLHNFAWLDMWVNFGFGWLKCSHFSIIKVFIQVLYIVVIVIVCIYMNT